MYVVFGAGQVGSGLARRLAAEGHAVRVVRRSAAALPGVEVVSGDARDPAFAREVTRGATALFHCMNPSVYTSAAWETEFPALGEALIGAALATDAKLVCLDNLYGYGVVERRTEDTPMAATGRKGRVRAAWDARLRGAAGLRWAAGRAGDFFGPGADAQSLFGTNTLANLAAGKAAWLVGDGHAPHAFSYVPDVIAGLAALGTSDAEGAWHLPIVEVAPIALAERLGRAFGTGAGARVVPGWAFTAAAPFVPLLRELRETMYQWDRPFHADDARFRARFPGVATALEGAVVATVEAYREGAARAA